MSIITKKGDKGKTTLLSGKVSKTDIRIDAIGDLDELNASIGVAISYMKDKEAKKTLKQTQNNLFKIGAEIAAAKTAIKTPKITAKETKQIEQEIHKTEKKLPKQKKFIIPAGNKAAAYLHLARTICRRAERSIIKTKPRPEIIKYLNRLGDLLFIYARRENKKNKQVRYK